MPTAKATIIVIVYVFLLNLATAVNPTIISCYKPKCYAYQPRNASTIVGVNSSHATSGTTFCFVGLQESFLYLWANPVLKISRKVASINETSKFLTYFGTSVADVEDKRKQPGYAIVQNWLSSLRSLKQSEDISLQPFNLSCYIIDTNVDYTAHVKIKAADLWYIAYLILGVLIFISAKSWSHNTTLHYSTGVSIGVVASVLLLFFVLAKFLPSRLKSIGYLLMLFGTSASLWVLTSVSNYFTEPVTDTFVQYWQYFVGYVLIVGVLSFALVYRYGPVTDERTLSLIQWFLQLVGLVLVYNSTQIREVSIALIIVLLTLYNFPRRIFLNERTKNIWYRFFPPKIKLLTDDEYMVQGNLETKRELDKLREYCRSPDCQAWKVISKLNSPHRFSDYIVHGTWHISQSELAQHEYRDDPAMLDNDAPSDTESELVFVLGSPSRTVRA